MKKFKYIILALVLTLAGCSIKSKSGMIISRLQKASKISTTKVVISKYVYYRKGQGKIGRLLSDGNLFLAQTEATIKFGIDFSKLGPQDISIWGDQITLTLPEVEIINVSYPAEQFHVDTIISSMRGDLPRIGVEEMEELYRDAELQIRTAVDSLKIYSTAEDNTRRMVEQLCRNMGFQAVNVQFANGKRTYKEKVVTEVKDEEDK